MSRSANLLGPLFLASAAALSLSAAEPRFGLQGALALPQADLTDSANPGLQFGGHAKWDFGQGHGLLARADLTFFGRKDGTSASSLGGGADYTYHLDRNARGFYLLAGASVLNYHYRFGNNTRTGSALGPEVGGGFDVDRNLGFQVRYTVHDLSNASLGSLNLGVTYTF
jgi:hypothetical protein